MSKKINLIYSKSNSCFFSQIKAIKKINQDQNVPQNISFDEIDMSEIARGYDYLDNLNDEFTNVTIDGFKEALANQGIIDPNFQDRIIYMILQSKIGIQFAMHKVANDCLFELVCKDFTPLLRASSLITDLKVKDNKTIVLNLNGKISNSIVDDEVIPVSCHVGLTITPEKVLVHDFSFEKIADDHKADYLLNFLEKDIHNILMRFILWIKRCLGFNAELCLQESEKLQPTV